MSIKDRSRADANGDASFGAALPSAGTHTFKVGEGIRLMDPNDNGRQSLMIPFIVDGGPDEVENGSRFNHFLDVKGGDPRFLRMAELQLCTFIDQMGFADKVDKAFGNPDNLFDADLIGPVSEMLATVMVDKYIRLETRIDTGTDGKKRCKVNGSSAIGASGATGGSGSGVTYG